ncbi:MAG: formylglycine-generating enzyme family protein [bacterium]|nr:formylglycine-generating enzyme family protein [bacterium]
MRKVINLFLIMILVLVSCGENPKDKSKTKQPVERKYKEKISNSIGMDLVYIKPGTFLMGPDYKMDYIMREDEHPHKVTLTKGFYMQTTETTVGQWRKFIKETGYKTHAEQVGFGWYLSGRFDYKKYNEDLELKKKFWNHVNKDEYPVTMITWVDCKVFLKWLSSKENESYRLPTEAEWEYACRANLKSHYPHGNLSQNWEENYKRDIINPELDKYAWYSLNSEEKTHPVALKKPNIWGLYDMVGNVSEYCQDTFTRRYPNKHVTDPLFYRKWTTILTNNKNKVTRGGSWYEPEQIVTSSSRDGRLLYNCENTTGFRVVKNTSQADYKK